MSIDSYYAPSEQFTQYLFDKILSLFLPQFQHWQNLIPAVSRVHREILVVGYAPVDHGLLEGLDYILFEVLLDAKD